VADRNIPNWARSALVNGRFYRRMLVPNEWIPDQKSQPTLTSDQIRTMGGNIAFYAVPGRQW
jgi:hypothetical protein